MAYSLRHNLPDVGLENMLKMIDGLLPESVYSSKYKFLKEFPYPKVMEYYFCPECFHILDFESEVAVCSECLDRRYKKRILKKLGSYFLYMPLKDQLISVINSKLYVHFRRSSDDGSDLINGNVYKQLIDKHLIGCHDITLTWNTDGVSMFTSSKSSLWPLQVSINEMPYRIRKNNILLCGLWFHKKKPPMNLFLKPFVDEMLTLSRDGFESTTFFHAKPINIKVHAVLSCVDSVARPAIQNMAQFNGKYGCSYCFHQGEQVLIGRGSTRIYPHRINQRRTSRLHEQIVQMVVEKEQIIKGVKGPSITSLLPHFDIIESYPPEYMHACLLGVAKLFSHQWFHSSNSGKEWYLGQSLELFNDRILSIKPPSEITRAPQGIDNKYKASEWKSFILYYSLPCLSGLLPSKYLKHWFLFVFSINTFSKCSVTEEEFGLAKTALLKFVEDVERLYGKTLMKYNVHLLSHIPHFIKLYGPLWAWSAFPFEHFNGIVKNLCHGTQCILEQVFKLYSRLRYIKNNSDIFSSPNCNEKAQKIFIKLMDQCRVKNCIEYGEDLRIFGKAKLMKLSIEKKIIIESMLAEEIQENVHEYHRFIYKNMLCHSSNYKRLTKRNNSCVSISDGSVLSISCLLKVYTLSQNNVQYVILGHKLTILPGQELCKKGNYSSNSFSLVVHETSMLICKKISEIKSKCIIVPFDGEKSVVFPIVNNIETD